MRRFGVGWKGAVEKHSAATYSTATDAGLNRCHLCGWVAQRELSKCPRCGEHLHTAGGSDPRLTWALLIASVILYIPANVLPILEIEQLGRGEPKTIMGGVIELVHAGLYPIAFVVFVASVVVPVLKIFGLMLLLWSTSRNWALCPVQRTMMFRWIGRVGRWSMLDVFVIALLAALVHLGNVAEIRAGIAASAFAGVVILTMFAAHSFDSRRMWQQWEKQQQ